jgi:hypothetical protein
VHASNKDFRVSRMRENRTSGLTRERRQLRLPLSYSTGLLFSVFGRGPRPRESYRILTTDFTDGTDEACEGIWGIREISAIRGSRSMVAACASFEFEQE